MNEAIERLRDPAIKRAALRRTDAGLSLVEVLTGLSIFAVIAAGLASSTIATMRANQVSKETAAASALVQDALEKFRSIDTAMMATQMFNPGFHSDDSNPVTPFGEPGGYFTRTWTITADTPRTGMKKVVVTVSWNSNGSQRAVNGVAYLCTSSTCT